MRVCVCVCQEHMMTIAILAEDDVIMGSWCVCVHIICVCVCVCVCVCCSGGGWEHKAQGWVGVANTEPCEYSPVHS